MNRRKKYRFFVICCLALDLLAIFWLGYKYLDRKIPDEIQISRDSGESTEDVTEVLSAPLVTFEKAVLAGWRIYPALQAVRVYSI